MQSVTLSLFRFGALSARLWAFAQMGLARRGLSNIREIETWKLCGSGTGEGFTPVPNTAVYAILATWPDHDAARRAIHGSDVFRRYREHASESRTLFLSATSARGTWAGEAPFAAGVEPNGGPIAALTRATIKPRIAAKFWGRVPGISKVIGEDPNVLFKIGIGEVPWLHQVTFSIWPDADSMAAFARHDGPHARAIRAVRTEQWFKEDLYARFNVDAVEGVWEGRAPDLPLANQMRDDTRIAAE
ncbi:spheroidene monooxygenase [Gymnodinialimonas hymeniacidonis]|uniref:spheroidene monooxygenase n=1 Tax=Gymnodinialimonas hymeniacidonis TaxID=3126508 RepID=UPI0034C64D6B